MSSKVKIPQRIITILLILIIKKSKEKVNADITGIAILRPDGIEEIKYLGERKC